MNNTYITCETLHIENAFSKSYSKSTKTFSQTHFLLGLIIMVSIKDISLACGVSVATVSKALNDQKDVGAATKERVKAVAKQMGYVPNSASQALKTKHSYNIGVLYKEESEAGLAHDFYAKVLDGIKTTAEQKGYDITFVNNSNMSGGRHLSYLEHCRYRNFDGVAIVCVDFDDPGVQELISSEVPVVTIDYTVEGHNGISSDNIGGMKELVEYAYTQGHRRIAFIHGVDSYVTRDRIRSFVEACNGFGLEVPAEYIKEAAYRDTSATYIATKQLIELKNPPTCILFPDDFAAIGGINCIHSSGLKIPDDISCAGFDGIDISKYLEPPLTTLNQDKHRIGSEAALRLIDIIENGDKAKNDNVSIPGELFKGGTIGSVK